MTRRREVAVVWLGGEMFPSVAPPSVWDGLAMSSDGQAADTTGVKYLLSCVLDAIVKTRELYLVLFELFLTF